LRASIFLKRHSFHKLLQLLGARRSTWATFSKRCSSSMTSVIALLWDNLASSLSTIVSAILISLRQSEIAARR
jgi:Mg2+ and Co2+ transporter CorA